MGGQSHVFKGNGVGIAIGCPVCFHHLGVVQDQDHIIVIDFDQLLLGIGGDENHAVRTGILDDVNRSADGFFKGAPPARMAPRKQKRTETPVLRMILFFFVLKS